MVLFLSTSNLLPFGGRSPSSSRLRLLKEFEELLEILVLVGQAPQRCRLSIGQSERSSLLRTHHMPTPRRAYNQRLADFLVLLPVFPLANPEAMIDDASACFARGEG
jgi:hypothetical protein